MSTFMKRPAVEALLLAGAVLLASTLAGFCPAQADRYHYPPAKTVDVSDNYHGTVVQDPYRWLEDPEAKETVDWVEQQNALTSEYINSYPDRGKIEEWMRRLWNYPRYTLPVKRGERYFFSKNDGLQNQSVLYFQESLGGKMQVVIDPNGLSADGTIALTNQAYSENGKLLAFGLSSSGSDRQEIHIRDIDTGRDYDEVLKWCKFTSIAWKHDHSGFYYDRFPAEGEVPPEDLDAYNRVYWHGVGTSQSQDVLVYEDPAHKDYGSAPTVTDDGKYLVLWMYHGTDPNNGLYYREVESSGEFIHLMELGEAKFNLIDNVGTTWFISTNLDAPRSRIIAIDITRPGRSNWREVVPESNDVIAFVTMVNDQLVVAYMRDAHHVLKIFDQSGAFVREIELPTIGSIAGLSGRRTDKEMFFNFTSFVYPTTAFRYDFGKNEVKVFRKPEVAFDPAGYTTEQVFYTSKDGTRVPMFLTYRKGLEKNGENPTWLYGYGGFNISMTPWFSITRLLWLESGGIYAVANIRGGEEYGEEWHQGGILDRKQNVFDDFIAAGEYLIKEKYTSTFRLLISGESNGGLLVAACMTQRPDLFGAIVCQVPVTDMLRYHKFTIGRYWASDFGIAEESAEAFRFLYAYSPLHNVKPGTTYPPTLVTTADTDDRVVPAHAKKFAAALQAADSGKNPILVRVETKAGHGGGKPTSKVIEEVSDIYAFVFKTFGIKSKAL